MQSKLYKNQPELESLFKLTLLLKIREEKSHVSLYLHHSQKKNIHTESYRLALLHKCFNSMCKSSAYYYV